MKERKKERKKERATTVHSEHFYWPRCNERQATIPTHNSSSGNNIDSTALTDTARLVVATGAVATAVNTTYKVKLMVARR